MKKTTKLIILTSALAVVGVVVGALLVALFKYDKAWYPGTTINGVDVSGMEYDESLEALGAKMTNYTLNINGRTDGKLSIAGEDISLSLGNTDEVAKIYNDQHDKFSFSKLFSKDEYNVELGVNFDEAKLAEIIGSSEIVAGSDSYEIIKPQNAKVEYSETEKRAVIIPEVEGNEIDPKVLREYVKEVAGELAANMNLTDTEKYPDVYVKAEVTSEDENLISTYHTYNTYLYQWITWDMGEGHYETITPDEIREWISLKSNGKVVLDKDKMAEWIEQFCLKYKTVGQTRSFTTHDGKKINVEGGDYGWRIDYDKTVEATYTELTKEKEWGAVEAYINDPTTANQNNLTTTWEPEYSNTAYKMNYENPTADWDTKNYSEVDISEQKVYVYKDGKLAHECICVTGLPSDPERKTKTGCYYIKEKKETYTLRGDNYTTPTKYWIRIMWSGTGYHYMNRSDWRSWTKETYLRRGSHGCINLQLEDAKTLYGLIDFNDAVFIHE